MKHFLMISAVLVLGCCFGGTLYAQAPCCKPKTDCKMVCAPGAASADNGGETSIAAVSASATGKACAGQTAQAAPTARPMGVFVADTGTDGAAANAAAVPMNCDWSKCLPPDCDPTKCDISKCLPPNCDLSKCLPSKGASATKASKAVRL